MQREMAQMVRQRLVLGFRLARGPSHIPQSRCRRAPGLGSSRGAGNDRTLVGLVETAANVAFSRRTAASSVSRDGKRTTGKVLLHHLRGPA